MKKILPVFFIAVVAVSGCSHAGQSAFDPATVKKDIEGLNQQFSALFVKGDSVGVANMYTKDAEFMDAGAPAVAGRPAIQTTMAGFMKAGITKVDLQTTNVFGCDSLVAEEGQLKLFVQAQKVADDKYIVLWKREDGKWKMLRDISNSNLPAAK